MRLSELKEKDSDNLTLSELKRLVKHYELRVNRRKKSMMKQYGQLMYEDMGFCATCNILSRYKKLLEIKIS